MIFKTWLEAYKESYINLRTGVLLDVSHKQRQFRLNVATENSKDMKT